MKFNIIASGSKGNATIVSHNKTNILIDMGISLTRLNEGLAEFNLTVKDINAVIFTHDHADHICNLKSLSPKIMYALQIGCSGIEVQHCRGVAIGREALIVFFLLFFPVLFVYIVDKAHVDFHKLQEIIMGKEE